MKAILDLALFFTKDLIYRKIILVSFLISFAFISLSVLLGNLSFSEQSRIAINFSLAGTQISLIILSVLLGAEFLKADIESSAVHSFLSRPINRFQYLAAKFKAFGWVLFFMTLVMWLAFYVVSLFIGFEVGLNSFLPFLGAYFEALILFSFAVFCSLFTSYILSVVSTFTLFLFGHWLETLHFLASKSQSEATQFLADVLVKILPNLEALNWKSHLTYDQWSSAYFYFENLVYAYFWVLFLFLISLAAFNRKDLP